MITSIRTVTFQRENADSKWEEGIMLNEDQVVIDGNLEKVPKIYDYNFQIDGVQIQLDNLMVGRNTPSKKAKV